MDTQTIMDNIKSETSSAPKQMFLGCPHCKRVVGWNMAMPLPTICGACGTKDVKYVMASSYEEVVQKRDNPPTPVQPALPNTEPAQSSEPAKPEPAKPEPAKPESAKPESAKPEPAKPESAKPVATRKRAAKPAPTKPEPEAVESAPMVTEPTEKLVDVTMDARELRRKAIERLTTIKNLTPIQFRNVGTARVYSLGFTEWVLNDEGQRIPSYEIKLPTDDSATFRQLMTEARRRSGGTVMIDCAMMTDIEPGELADCLFNGQLVASLMTPRGPVSVLPGAKVELLASLSKSGSLIFRVGRIL